MRGATKGEIFVVIHFHIISIHAPLAGCDHGGAPVRIPVPISIHAPLAGCDGAFIKNHALIDKFQSTHPLRGATGCHLVYDWRCQGHFNPRTPCGVRPLHQPLRPVHRHISIHAPLAGCDSDRNTPSSADMHFNPRTPCGVRPAYIRMLIAQDAISIHAPLAGCDLFLLSSIEIGSISIHAPLAGCDR